LDRKWLDEGPAVIAELKAGAVPHRAASILGSVKDPRALSPLVEALEHCDRRVRMASALALGGLGNAAALAPLLRATRDSEHLVRVQAGHALDRVRTTAAGFDVSALVGPIIIDAVRCATDHGALRHSPRTRDGELPVLAAGESSRQVDPTKLRNLAAFVDHLGAAGLGRQSLSAGGERAAQVEESRKGG
jgi:hypothetical protein